MPYTRKQVKYLLSKVSPLSEDQQDKVKSELHADPSLGHQKKGSAAMKRGPREAPVEGEKASGYNWRRRHGRNKA